MKIVPWQLVVGTTGYVGVRVIYLHSNLYTYKASKCKRAIIRLHCATSKSSLWNMEYVARGGAFECSRIYRISRFIEHVIVHSQLHVHVHKHSYMYEHVIIITCTCTLGGQ